MKFEYLLKVIKHSLTLKSVREQLSEPLKKLTDNNEEYEFLMKRVPKFYVEYYNHPIEHIEVWDKEGNVHMNDGTEFSVHHPETMNHETPYQLSIHNHANKVSEMQSNGDYGLQVEYNTKYGVSVGFHGLVITKNGYPFDPEKCRDYGDEAYYNGDIAVERRFHKMRKEDPVCIKAKEDWRNDKITMQEMDDRITDRFIEELNTWDINVIVEEQNKVYEESGIPLKSTYLPIKKVYE